MTSSHQDAPLFELTAVPLAWTVIRQYRNGLLAEPAKWLKATNLPKETQGLVDAIEAYMGREDNLVDLGSWVMDDLPPRVAHIIDTATDLIWTLTILLAARAISSGGGPGQMAIGPALHSRRSDVIRVMDEIAERADAIERDFGLRDLQAALPRVKTAFDSAVKAYERAEDEATISKPLSPARIDQLRASLVREWRDGFPRALLATAGSVRIDDFVPTGKQMLTTGAWMPREILQDDTSFVDDSPRQVGESLASAFTNAESETLGEAIGRTRRYRRGTTLEARVRAVLRGLPGATHLLIPYSFRVIQALGFTEVGTLREWSFAGLQTLEWRDVPTNSVVVLKLPDAVTVRMPRSLVEPVVAISEVDEARAAELSADTAPTEDHPDSVRQWRTRIHVDARSPWRFSIDRRAIRVVELPQAHPD